MDWMECQIPPPSWQDEGEIIPNSPGDEAHCPLTSMVRRCYLKHLEQTLVQNYESCRTKTIQQSTLRDFILHWEQNALRASMMTVVYQRAMLQVINAIKSDTKQRKLASVLTASIKKLKTHRRIDVSTQTAAVATTETEYSGANGHGSKCDPGSPSAVHKSKREPSLNKESSVGNADGPFLTPPSDYPQPNVHTTKECAQNFSQKPPTYASQGAPGERNSPNPLFQNSHFQMPVHFNVPPPGYPALPPDAYPTPVTSVNNWSLKEEPFNFTAQPLSGESQYSVNTEYPDVPGTQEPSVTFNGHELYSGHNAHANNDESNMESARKKVNNHCKEKRLALSGQPPQPASVVSNQTCDTVKREVTPHDQINCNVEKSPSFHNAEFTLGLSDMPEPDYNWDQIEEEMARLCGQVFTEADNQEKPEEKPVVLSEPPNNWDVLGNLHEEELQYRLEQLRLNGSLERQANLKRKFTELFGRDGDDELPESSPIETVKCKRRIAPWVVKHLMPLYKEKRIASRHLFKSLAKHISDLLVQRNLFPDECDVWMGIQEFFSSGTTIQCEADFCA